MEPWMRRPGTSAYTGMIRSLTTPPPPDNKGLGLGSEIAQRAVRGAQQTMAGAPVNLTPPALAGPATPGTGNVYTVTAGTWKGTPPLALTYEWRVNSTIIAGQTGTSYTAGALAAGDGIIARETARNQLGSDRRATDMIGIGVSYPLTIDAPADGATVPAVHHVLGRGASPNGTVALWDLERYAFVGTTTADAQGNWGFTGDQPATLGKAVWQVREGALAWSPAIRVKVI